MRLLTRERWNPVRSAISSNPFPYLGSGQLSLAAALQLDVYLLLAMLLETVMIILSEFAEFIGAHCAIS